MGPASAVTAPVETTRSVIPPAPGNGHHAGPAGLPAAIVLGSGKAPRPGAVNVDISAACQPDIVHDLRRFPWPFPDESFGEIWCHDVLEHLPDTVRTMEEIHRIAAPGAVVYVTTPHFSCANAFTDPTHVRQFGFFSFDYFTGDATHDHYTDVRFRYGLRLLVFHPSRKNTLVRRIANRWPESYERHLCWLLPAWFISLELVVVK